MEMTRVLVPRVGWPTLVRGMAVNAGGERSDR